MNGLKNASLTKTNPFFHLHAFTFKFRKNKTQVKWRKTSLKSEVPGKQNNLSFVYCRLYTSQKKKNNNNNLTFFPQGKWHFTESQQKHGLLLWGQWLRSVPIPPSSPHPIPQNSVPSSPQQLSSLQIIVLSYIHV